MTSINDYLSSSKTIPETPIVNTLQLYESVSNGTESTILQANSNLSSDFEIQIPENCNYIPYKKVYIPILTKIKEPSEKDKQCFIEM